MTIFFRLLDTDDKGTTLHQAIQQLAQQQPNPNTKARRTRIVSASTKITFCILG